MDKRTNETNESTNLIDASQERRTHALVVPLSRPEGNPARLLVGEASVTVRETPVRESEWIPGLSDLHRLEHAGVGELLDAHPVEF